MTINDIIKSNDYPQNEENFNKLVNLCKSGNIVPFVGAGLSIFAGLPSWQGFIDDLKAKCPDKSFLTDNLLKAADEIERQLGKEEFYRIFKQTFHYDKDDDWWEKVIKENEVQKQAVSVIPDLFNGPIITTNFDKILEAVHRFSLPISLPDNVSVLKDVNKKRKHLIYKIHGCVSDPDNIIFTGKSYEEAYYKHNSPLVKTLSEFYQGFCFLFLGSSLKLSENEMDESIKLWTKLTRSGMFHYAILECSKENEQSRRIELEQQQIYPIFFPEGKFESIKIILDELLKRKNASLLKGIEYHSEYVIREAIQKRMEQYLWTKDFSVAALIGSGGVGKTRVACEYEKNYKNEYFSGTYFFRAISKENVQTEIYRFAVEKGLISKDEKNQTFILQTVKKWMHDNDSWLFILDNVEHFEHIENLLALNVNFSIAGKRHFLITSRNQNLPIENKIDVGVFNIDEARAFFKTHVKKHKPDGYANNIIEALGRLPLALEQSAAFIRKQNISYKEYIEVLDNDGMLETLKKGNHEDGTLAVGATYNLSLRMLEHEESRMLLNLCSFFASNSILCNWFTDKNEQLNLYPSLQEKVKDENEYKKILSELVEYSLISLGENSINIHPLTQEVVRKSIKTNERDEYIESCVKITHELRFEDFSTAELLNTFNGLSPHIISIVQYVSADKQTEEVANLLRFLGWGFNELANYTRALEFYQKALTIQQKLFDENQLTAVTYNDIGFIHSNQGHYDIALTFYKKALSIQEKESALAHPYSASIYNNIARIYTDQGEYNNALMYSNLALKIYENIKINNKDGKESIYATTIYNHIGFIYYSQGEYDLSLDYFFRALKIREKILGKKHPFTAITYINIGMSYYSLGENDMALEYYYAALKIRKKVFGEDHLELAGNYNNIANVLSDNGDYDAAMFFYQKALDIQLRNLGEEHPDTASTYINIGAVYDDKGMYNKALEHYQKALGIQRKIFKENHPDIALTYNNIGTVHYISGEYDSALYHFQKALDIQEKVLGIDHPDTANTYNNIGAVYNEKGLYDTALKCFLSSYKIRLSKLGPTHPNTVITKGNMELAHKKSGNTVSFVQWLQNQML